MCVCELLYIHKCTVKMLININVMFKITYSVNLPTSKKITLNELHGQMV